jgi:glycosyltransferase involved in cell wall biosynthesis
VLDPDQEPRSAMFKAMTTRILSGMQQAARITCDTAAVRDELVNRGLVPAERVITVPIGVDAAFQPAADPDADAEVSRLVGPPGSAIELLHVGSTVPRKRIDTLLQIVAAAARSVPDVRLVRVGGPFTADQERLLGELGLLSRVTVLPPLNDRRLAAVYRRAALVLLPSMREGFGLPVVEALTCGTPVLASDLTVLREVGGGDGEYCPVGDVDAWVSRTVDLLRERVTAPERWQERRARGRAWAHRFTWTGFASSMAAIYADLACRG